jgi:hypothetical protein
MDTSNDTDFEFIRKKTVTELKDICRVNNVCGFSRLRKNELCDLLITYYKKNPEQLKKDLQIEEQYNENNETLFNNLIVEPQQSVPQVVPFYIQGPVQEVVKRVIVQHVRAPFVLSQAYKNQLIENVPKAPSASKAPKAPSASKAHKAQKTPKAPSASKAPKTPKAPSASKAPKTPKAPKAPKTPKAPKAQKAPSASKAPKAQKAPKTPKAQKAPKAPKAPKTPKAPKAYKAPKAPKAQKAPKSYKAPKAPKAPKAYKISNKKK